MATERDRIWAQLDGPWDVLVIGGGITGAGILREAVRMNLRALLVEQKDFAWGTSSRSSKLVHGGLRYLKEGKLGLTRAAVRERQRLLAQGPGLIDPLGFLLTTYRGDSPGRWTFRAGLSLYDLLALQWTHRQYTADELQLLAPHITQDGLEGGLRYGDAQTDDARLVLRLIQEAVGDGGVAINYVRAETLLRDSQGQLAGVRVRDMAEARDGTPAGSTGNDSHSTANENPTASCDRPRDLSRTAEVTARVVINATGAWADRLRRQVGEPPRIRPLRGSHLVFPAWRLPVAQAISFLHPIDRRPVFILPWEGVTLVGTTDVDHDQDLDQEPRIGPQEVAYLMAAVEALFPSLNLTLDDVISSFAGVRPVIGTGKQDPSDEARDHVVWQEQGLLTVTGGKLTTFCLIAHDALQAVAPSLARTIDLDTTVPALNPVQVDLPENANCLDSAQRRRLLGRYGALAPALCAAAQANELQPIPGTQVLWVELRWAARHEGVVHLEDLLLRRVRLGLLLPQGASALLPQIRQICQAELGWSDARWNQEQAAYLARWQQHYNLPDRSTVSRWQGLLANTQGKQRAILPLHRRRAVQLPTLAGLVTSLGLATHIWLRRRRGRRSTIDRATDSS